MIYQQIRDDEVDAIFTAWYNELTEKVIKAYYSDIMDDINA